MVNSNIDKIGRQNYFYNVDIDNNQIKQELDLMFKIYGHQYSEAGKVKIYNNPQLIEDYFSRVENEMSVLFEKFKKENEIINEDEFLIKFYIFISGLAIRTVGYREKLETFNEQLFDQLKKFGIKEIHGMNVESSPKDSAKQAQLKQIASLAHSFENAKIFFSNYDFYVGINDTGFPLIIGDEVALNVEMMFNDICIPITPSLAIIMRSQNTDPKYYISKDMPSGKKIILTKASVFAYNILQYYQANRFVFGDKTEIQRLQILIELLQNPIFQNLKDSKKDLF